MIKSQFIEHAKKILNFDFGGNEQPIPMTEYSDDDESMDSFDNEEEEDTSIEDEMNDIQIEEEERELTQKGIDILTDINNFWDNLPSGIAMDQYNVQFANVAPFREIDCFSWPIKLSDRIQQLFLDTFYNPINFCFKKIFLQRRYV